jgi:hypothetical protein
MPLLLSKISTRLLRLTKAFMAKWQKTAIPTLSVLVLVYLVSLLYHGNAQPADSSQRSISNPNAVEGNLSFQTFFDGYGMMQSDHREHSFFAWANPKFSFTYKRRITKWDAISMNFGHFRAHYFTDSIRTYEPGDFTDRKFFIMKAYYLRYLIFNERINIKAKGGLDYRHGGAMYHVFYTPLETDVDNYQLRDIGVSVGFEVEIKLIWQLYWSGKCSYTRFLYTYDESKRIPPLNNGPSKNMFSVQTGVGCWF